MEPPIKRPRISCFTSLDNVDIITYERFCQMKLREYLDSARDTVDLTNPSSVKILVQFYDPLEYLVQQFSLSPQKRFICHQSFVNFFLNRTVPVSEIINNSTDKVNSRYRMARFILTLQSIYELCNVDVSIFDNSLLSLRY